MNSASAELVTVAPGLRPERRFAPLARGKSKQDICKLADENLNLKSRLTELEAKVLFEGQLNNTIGYKENIDTTVINEVNPSSINANSIPLNSIFQTAKSKEVNDNHSKSADDLSTQISQPVFINKVIIPDVTRKPLSCNPKTVVSKPNNCGVQTKNQNEPISTRIIDRRSPQLKRKFVPEYKKDARIRQTYHVNNNAIHNRGVRSQKNVSGSGRKQPLPCNTKMVVSKVKHCGDQTKNQNQPIPTRITNCYPSRFKRKFSLGYKNCENLADRPH